MKAAADQKLEAALEQLAAIRVHVAEMEREIERNAWTLSPEMVQTRNDQLAAENDALKQRNAELEAALRKAANALESDNESERHAAWNRIRDLNLARSESATPVVNESFATDATPAKHTDTERLDHLVAMASRGSKMGVFIPGGTTRETLDAFIDGDAARKQGGAAR